MQHESQDAIVDRLLTAARTERAAGRLDQAMTLCAQAMALAPWRVRTFPLQRRFLS